MDKLNSVEVGLSVNLYTKKQKQADCQVGGTCNLLGLNSLGSGFPQTSPDFPKTSDKFLTFQPAFFLAVIPIAHVRTSMRVFLSDFSSQR